MLLSIIVPCFNAGAYLEGLVSSLAAAGAGALQWVEVILVDDGSTDGSAALMARLAAEKGWLKCLGRPNGGPAAARNLGAAQASGEFLMFLDADDELEQGALLQVEAFLRAHPGHDFYIGRAAIVQNGAGALRRMPAQLSGLSARSCVEDYLNGRVSIQQGAYLVRREAFLTCPFPEGLRTQEDIPFFLASLARGNVCGMPVDMLRYHRYRGVVSRARHEAISEGFAGFDLLFQAPYLTPALLAFRGRLYRTKTRALLRYIAALGEGADIWRVMRAYRERVGGRAWMDVPLYLKALRTAVQVWRRQRRGSPAP